MTLTEKIREIGKIAAAVSLGIGVGYAHYTISNPELVVLSPNVAHLEKLESSFETPPSVRCYSSDNSDTPAITCYNRHGDGNGNGGGIDIL